MLTFIGSPGLPELIILGFLIAVPVTIVLMVNRGRSSRNNRGEGGSCWSCKALLPGGAQFCPDCGEEQEE